METETVMTLDAHGMSATYSPEDNKLRLYTVARLDKETYTRARALGFIYAPKQQLFVAPAWKPSREDFLLELCGEIGDEDTTLVDRAEQRADRFEDYSSKRAQDAESARKRVDQIAERFHGGQPILVGHHSERGARKDKERIENGMRKAIRMWETSEYWTHRAAGAIRAAKYKELPGVRARRIKGLEAEERKMQKQAQAAAAMLLAWTEKPVDNARALVLADSGKAPMGVWSDLHAGKITADEAREKATASANRVIAWAERWLNHLGNRLAYERAMMAETGGTAADKTNPEVGGACKCWASHRGGWSYIMKVNAVTVTVLDNWGNGGQNFTRAIPFDKLSAVMSAAQVEELRSSRSLAEFDDKTGFLVCAAGSAPESVGPAALAKSTVKPLLNYPGVVCYWTSWGGGQYPEGVEAVHMTKAEYDALPKSSREIRPAKDNPEAKHNTHRVRVFTRIIEGRYTLAPVFLTDSKQHPHPAAAATPPPAEIPQATTSTPKTVSAEGVSNVEARTMTVQPEPCTASTRTDPGAVFAAMKQTLKEGVQVVCAPQLFPTPPALAARMVELAEIEPGHRVLEPSAGTGNLLKAIPAHAFKVAVEVNGTLAQNLNWIGAAGEFGLTIVNRDFMEAENLGSFDRVVMNPPFEKAQDIEHIRRALALLKPGGRLVAICANGPRQNAALRPLVEEQGGTWETLPPDTFRGTSVRAVLLVLVA